VKARVHGRRELWQLQLYNVSTEINFTIFQLQQRGGVRTYRTCVSSMRGPKGIIQLLNYNHNAPDAYFPSVIPQWDAPRERLYCMRVSPFFGALLLYRTSVHCMCAVCVERRAAHDSDLSAVYSITNGFHPLTHCQQLDLLFGDYAAFMPDLLFVIIWLTSHAVYNPCCVILLGHSRTAFLWNMVCKYTWK
jgi:hypothetical protein